MSKTSVASPYFLSLTHVVILSGILVSSTASAIHSRAEAILYNVKPASIKHYSIPHHSRYGIGYMNSDSHFKQNDPIHVKSVSVSSDEIFQIEASDAIDGIKFSQPDVPREYLLNLNSGMKVPSLPFVKHKLLQTSAQNPSLSNIQDQPSSISLHSSEKNLSKPMRDIRYLDSAVDEEAHLSTESGQQNQSLKNNNFENLLQTHSHEAETTNLSTQTRNNFTDAGDNLVPVSSDAVLSYEIPSEFNDSSLQNSSVKQIDIVSNVPSHNYSDFNFSTEFPVSKTSTMQTSVEFNTHIYIDYINQTSEENATNSLPSTDSERKLSSGTVAGIVIAVLVSVTLLSSAVIYLLYRKFNGKCTSVVESKFNTDNCGYLDDSLRSSIYLNNHIELPKESSEEMTSLDNDSFLNSLETMTIQNYWADNSKNTKV